MLSYQHLYHAGNLADVHKHAVLASALDYLTRKDKPLSYIETHAGRGLYDLDAPEARRTGEAEGGVLRAEHWFGADDPYARALAAVQAAHGPRAYPGSPMIARTLLRDTDRIELAELHPAEFTALKHVFRGTDVRVHKRDGLDLAASLCPPTPRRGLMLVDPSWEIKADYAEIPRRIRTVTRAWNVGIVMLWYPILRDAVHLPMLRTLMQDHPGALRHEVRFPPVREGHRMVGSGLFVINPPWGLDAAASRLDPFFEALSA